jgi:hypothetical protein
VDEDLKPLLASMRTLQKQVERVTAQGPSWDTVVQLLVIAGLIEVSSQLEALSKALSDVGDAPASPSPAKRGRGRPSGKGHAEV